MSRFSESTARLATVAWGAAPGWDDRAKVWFVSYYRRLALAWPSGRSTLPPADPEIITAALSPRTAAEREQIDAAVTAIRDSASKRGEDIMSTTRDLLPAILAWTVAVDASELAPSADPGEPLFDLFAAGFQLE